VLVEADWEYKEEAEADWEMEEERREEQRLLIIEELEPGTNGALGACTVGN